MSANGSEQSGAGLKTTKVQAFGGSNSSPSAKALFRRRLSRCAEYENRSKGPGFRRFPGAVKKSPGSRKGEVTVSSKSQKALGFSQTTGAPKYARPLEGPLGFLPVAGPKGLPGRPRAVQEKLLRPIAIPKDADEETAAPALAAANGHGETRLEPLVREWLLDLQVLGRSPKTTDWYRKHIHGYFQERSVRTLDQLTAAELKGYLAAIQARGLAENTVHGAFQTIKAFANWAVREGYGVDS